MSTAAGRRLTVNEAKPREDRGGGRGGYGGGGEAGEPVYAFAFSGGGTGGGVSWRDGGTLDAYFRANRDLLADAPDLDLYDKAWPVYSVQASFPPPKVALTPRR